MDTTDMRPRSLIPIAAILALLSSCAPTDTTTTTTLPGTSTSRPSTTTSSEAIQPANAADRLAAAVDSLVDADTYAFEATILLSVQGEPAEVELEGWVDGADRELVMKLEDRTVTTRVIDGVAMVEQGGETVEVPLEEAGTAPSIELLRSLQDPTFENDTTITGALDAADIAETDYEVAGSAAITVAIAADGSLAGYTMTSSDDSWSVDVRFSDIGEDPR